MAEESDARRKTREIELTEVKPGRGGAVDLDLSFEPRFGVGDVIADRYVVEGFIARGGMGEVYRVLDRELGERVALKTILPRSDRDPLSLDRFRREIQLARKVSHPNVCRIFDLGRHDDESSGDVVFLTMELLQGTSLRARLTQRPMEPDEAVSVIEQLCSGLGAAHRQGIIHRDLKPSNIFLVPESEACRVVITDFGLARTEVKADDEETMTRTGELLGTPAYMAPEQLEGEEATAASDIYAVGLIIFELLTGAKPFEGSSAIQVALNKLRSTPSTPSSMVKGLPPLWDRVILCCLEADPARRFESVEEIPRALAGHGGPPDRVESDRMRRWAPWIAALMLIAAAGVVGVKVATRSSPSPTASPAPSPAAVTPADLRRTVAVIGFENITGNPAAADVADELQRLLTVRLASAGELRVIPVREVRAERSELAIERLSTLGPETLAGLRAGLGVDLVVLGSCAVFTDEGTVRLDARVQDIEAGEIIIAPSVHGPVNDLDAVADDALAGIQQELGFVSPESTVGE